MYRFGHDGTRPTFTKAKWLLHWIMERTRPCFNMGLRTCLCFSTGETEAHDLWNICSSVCSGRMLALLTSHPLVPSQKSHSEIAEPASLTVSCHQVAVWEGKEDHGDGWWFPDSWQTYCTDIQSPIYFRAGPRMLTEYLTVYPYCVLGHRTHFSSMVFNLLLK